MVAWSAPGRVTGIIRDPVFGPFRLLFSPEAYYLSSPGTVDLNGATRFQYEISGLDDITKMYATASFTYDAADVTESGGALMGAAAALAPASAFAPGVVPTPAQIEAAAVEIAPGKNTGVFTTRTTPGSLTLYFDFDPAHAWTPNEKWWLLVTPCYFTAPEPVTAATMVPLGDGNINGRAVSLLTNRTPAAPVITSPLENVTFSGSSANIVFSSGDPDRVTSYPGDDYPHSFGDIAGVQIEYAPVPTDAEPTPTWLDLPIVSTDGTLMGRGWYIDRASQPGFLGGQDGAEQFWLTGAIRIQSAGAPIPHAGYLPEGEWQVRVRTFDYGHPMSTGSVLYPDLTYPPLNDTSGDYTPGSYPEDNTSPWSVSVFIAASVQVLPPLPLSPKDRVAVVEGSPVTLIWKYRNTNVPPFAQKHRTVQIRKVGDADWTTLTGDNTWDILGSNPDFAADGAGWQENYFESAWTWSAGAMTNTTGSSLIRTAATAPLRPFGTSAYRIRATFTRSVAADVVGRYSFGDTAEGAVRGAFWSPTHAVEMGADIQNFEAGTHTYEMVWVPESDPGAEYLWAAPSVTWVGAGTVSVDSVEFAAAAPSTSTSYDVTGFDLVSGNQYEWRVRVTDTTDTESDWSAPARFWVVPEPASGGVIPDPSETIDGATLGCGTHRIEIFRRGGSSRIGEIKNISSLEWNRVRDDISTAKIVVSGWDIDCGNLLAQLQSWAYEVVIFRDNGYSVDRVWEGPITLLTYEVDSVTIHAKDVMAFAYRRIIRQAMSDSGNSPTAGSTVTNRGMRVLQNAFAPDDPNVLAYLQVIENVDDAVQYRSVPAYSRTAFEEVDDMAANAGLDYTAVGRAILLWSTKHRIGTLPEFRDKDLGSSPIVSEYGMSMANVYVVSDGNGIYGEATRLNEDGEDPTYGLVEVLSSTWASDSAEEEGTYTQEGIETIKASFAEAAERSIGDRYPPPVVVRVPDNTRLNPDTVLSIKHLVPGVVVPLRSTGTLRTVVATQKLDAVKVVETGGVESITITLSPFSRDDVEVEEA